MNTVNIKSMARHYSACMLLHVVPNVVQFITNVIDSPNIPTVFLFNFSSKNNLSRLVQWYISKSRDEYSIVSKVQHLASIQRLNYGIVKQNVNSILDSR